MARVRKKTISRRTVEALRVEKDTVFWDRELTGFGVRVYPSGRKVYIAQARAKGKAAQRVTVAPHGVISPEEARRRAALIISRIKAGEEPVPEPSVGDARERADGGGHRPALSRGPRRGALPAERPPSSTGRRSTSISSRGSASCRRWRWTMRG